MDKDRRYAQMSEATILKQAEGNYLLKGKVQFRNVTRVQNDLYVLMKNRESFELNLQGIEHYDSSMLALMLSIVRHAKKLEVSLRFTECPEQLLVMAELYGVTGLIVKL